MNSYLQNALKELDRMKSEGAKVPTASEIEAAPEGTSRSGTGTNGMTRKFTKNSDTSYDIEGGKA